MPLKNGHLTAKEREFAKHMARTGDATYAAEKAGYGGAPVVVGSKLKSKPAVQAEVVRQYQRLMFEEGLPAAYRVHMELMQDAKTPHGARVTLVGEMYKQTVGKVADASVLAKEPSEMSYDELQASIETLREAQLAIEDQAQDITPAPPVEPAESVFD